MYQIYEKADKEELSDLDAIDSMIAIVADIFQDPAVSFDSILDGLTANELGPTLQGIFEQINDLGSDEKKSGKKRNKLYRSKKAIDQIYKDLN